MCVYVCQGMGRKKKSPDQAKERGKKIVKGCDKEEKQAFRLMREHQKDNNHG